VWDHIRDQFAYHYDSGALGPVIAADVMGGQFDLVSSEKVTNSFFISSEMAVWSAILGVHDDEAFAEAFRPLVEKAADLTADLVDVIWELFTAFEAHVVDDLGGSWEVESSTTSIAAVAYKNALLPLFAA
jgi:hypothetical protein